MLPDMMIHRQHSSHFTWPHRFAALLVASCLVAGCGTLDTGGAATNPADGATTVPPGGMGPGAIVAPTATRGIAATATSAPLVPVATVVRPAPTAPTTVAPVPPTAAPIPPTDVPAPPTPIPATRIPATIRTKPTAAPTERATATRRAATPSPVPTTKATAAPSATPHMVSYTVKKGDDVYAIARRFGVTPAAIITANDLANPNKIKVGQTLKVPVVGSPSETPAG